MKTQTTTISAQIPKTLAKRLSALAEAENRSKSYYIKEALNNFLDEKVDDIKDYIETEKRYRDFLASGKSSSLEEIADRYNLN